MPLLVKKNSVWSMVRGESRSKGAKVDFFSRAILSGHIWRMTKAILTD